MKKISIALSAAVFALLSISCQKEVLVADTTTNGSTQVFTCTFDNTKMTIDENNSPIWQEGDFIILYNGAKAETATRSGLGSITVNTKGNPVFYNGTEAITNNIIEKIDITADMISADGKTVTFTKTIDDAASVYYAMAESKGSNHVYSINQSGTVSYREVCAHTDTGAGSTEIVHAAVASCPAGQSTLSFKNVFCQLKFDLPAGKYQRVIVEANEGSANTFSCGISGFKFDASSIGTASSKTGDAAKYTLTLNNVDAGPYYIPVAPCANLDKGITIKCYKSSSDEEPYTVTISKKLNLARNLIINLGNLEEAKPITSYYEAWEEGRDIIINGVAYNKKTYGAGKLISEDTSFATDEDIKGAIFVAEGKTLSMPGNVRPKGSAIIMCDKPGKKANFAIGGGTIIPQADHVTYIVNSMNVTFGKNAYTYGGKIVDLVGFYSSKLTVNANYFSLTATSKIINTEIVGCDIETKVNDFGVHDGSKGLNKFETIIFNNNAVYSNGSLRSFRILRQGRTACVDKVGTIEIKNNTFYDVVFVAGLFTPKSVDAFYLENNIFAYSAFNESYQRCLHTSGDDTSVKTPPVEGYPASGKVLANIRFNSDRVLGVFNPAQRIGDKAWYATDYQEITTAAENPFATVDAANGVFTQKPAFAAYGAQR